jgi:hypothetical protein
MLCCKPSMFDSPFYLRTDRLRQNGRVAYVRMTVSCREALSSRYAPPGGARKRQSGAGKLRFDCSSLGMRFKRNHTHGRNQHSVTSRSTRAQQITSHSCTEMGRANVAYWHEPDESGRSDDVRLLGRTGSGRRSVKSALLTRTGHSVGAGLLS